MPDGIQEEFIQYNNAGLQGQPQMLGGMDMGLRVPEFDIEVTSEKANPYKKMEINELALSFYNMGFFNPQMTDQALACLNMMDFTKKDIKRAMALDEAKYKEWWTPEWRKAVDAGLLLKRDLPGGQMSRDMTVFIDDDGKAYHIHSAEENLTLNIAELTPDYLDYTGNYIRLAPGGHNEAPTILKRNGVYWMITSGCTGWDPNEARMFRAESIWGPWVQLPTPFRGKDADKSFHTQGTYIFKVEGTDEYVFMADRWMPRSLKFSRHIWLPISFEEDGTPVLEWKDSWTVKAPLER